uniref:snaclec coagulation factor IX/factor X-binding protein subunit A-like n=1 Tax=Styela clava TaxID=7725 RepID=UPI00193A3D35|nr:snaclec coagulation factor IX/factor X-binding protein subunit A-like [Styela clava]
MTALDEIIILLLLVMMKICLGQRGVWLSGKRSYEYYISPGNFTGTYYEAESSCKKVGGELAFIKSEKTQLFIGNLVLECTGKASGYFIGLRDVHNNGTFRWNDGTPMEYQNWNEGQPNVRGIQTCVTMGFRQSDEQLRWHDYYCADGGMGFVCQRKKCPRGWTRKKKYRNIKNSCFDDRGFKLDAASFMVGFTAPFLLLVIVITAFVMYHKKIKRNNPDKEAQVKQEPDKEAQVKQEPIYDVVAADDYRLEDNKSV